MSTQPPFGNENQDPFDDEFQEDPFIDDHFGKQKAGSGPSNANRPKSYGPETLPDSNAVLVLGIISIVGAFCYGIVGIIVAIVALAMAPRAQRLYEASPDRYSVSSFNNLKAGRVCAIIGLSISAVYLLVILGIFVFVLSEGRF